MSPLSLTSVDSSPVIARAAVTQAQPGILTRLLAPFGLSALTNTNPPAPTGLTSIFMGVIELVRREVSRIFFNQTPAFTYDSGQIADGIIIGKLTAVDSDSTTFTYTATKPAQGDVVVQSDGSFVYTPGAYYDGSDSFDVTISDDDGGFHIHGLGGLLNLITFGLIGDSGHTYTKTVTVGEEVHPITGFRANCGRVGSQYAD